MGVTSEEEDGIKHYKKTINGTVINKEERDATEKNVIAGRRGRAENKGTI